MSIKEHPPHLIHTPVLLEQTLELLAPKPGERYLDLTAGYGGHAREVLARTDSYESSVLVDRDSMTHVHLASLVDKGATLLHSDFLTAATELAQEGEQFDLILADLGVSSPQLDRAERGFSFSKPGPLDMRMDQRDEVTAAVIVNSYRESEIADIIVRYGEEPKPIARKIAAAIVEKRPFKQRTNSLTQSSKLFVEGRKKFIRLRAHFKHYVSR